MSSILDPAKLKVVELRAELSTRGLDSKGNKPALVKRLKEALEEELKQVELSNTSTVDTSTEEFDTSQNKTQPSDEESKAPHTKCEQSTEQNTTLEHEVYAKNTESVPSGETGMKRQEEPNIEPKEKESESENKSQESVLEECLEKTEEIISKMEESKTNGEQDEPKSRKSRWNAEADEAVAMQLEENNQTEIAETIATDKDSEPKGEKRSYSSPSPDRSQRRRSKSPIKEDEPSIDQDKAQLSWYDSDLHLQVDKESFLSAKPYHEGAFGFAWAGVRATHGVNKGKVCFEVKITEALKWEDFSKYYDKHRHDPHKSISKHKKDDHKIEGEVELKNKEGNCETLEKKGSKSENAKQGDGEVRQLKSQVVEENKESEAALSPEVEETVLDTLDVAQSKEQRDCSEQPENRGLIENREQTLAKERIELLPTHLFRVGWSLCKAGLQLGEDKYSYGYESSAKFVVDKQFRDYGTQFGLGDVIASFLSIDENAIKISYAINGVIQAEAISVPITEIPENFVLFPHVLSRNYAFELNLGSKEEPWFAAPESYLDYTFLDKMENKVAGPVRPERRSDCEVILMCGLPASGKTHWIKEFIQSNPDKKYTVLGNSHLLEKMTIFGNALKSNYKGSWNILLEKLQKCINKLVEIAALRRRNYIIDQPNVYPSAQRRKLRPFEGFKRRAVVVVVGDEEQAKQQSLQEVESGKDVPDSTILDMKANMSLPQKGDWIDEVLYVGVGEEESKALVQRYNSQARETIGIHRRFSHRDDRHGWQNRRNDYRGGNYRDRGYHNNRYDRGPPRQGHWHSQRFGGWNRDRRENRGPPVSGPRNWRNRGNDRDRSNRDSQAQASTYDRNRNQPGRGPNGNWPSGWGHNQSGWSSQPWGGQGSWSHGGWGGQNQNQWKYGGGSQSYGYSNWNYYGQYPQTWGSQGQTHSAGNTAVTDNNYGQYSQQDWAQYAQQYAQQGQSAATSMPSTPQK